MKYIALSALLISANALAWGPTGHRTVAEVAERNLSDKAMTEVKKILKGHSMARAAMWPDEIKSEPDTYKHTYVWHFTDWPDDMHEHDESKGDGKLLGQLQEQLKTIKSPTATAAEKEFALKFVIHMVGDLHQPLHVGNGIDRGGNNCKVTFHGQAINLHVLWDEAMIDFTKLSFTELAKFVTDGRTDKDRQEALSGSPLDWAAESRQIRGSIYPANVAASKEPISTRTYCQKDVQADAVPKLAYDYSYKFLPVVEKRIYQAGIRLASMLNQALASK